jgi:hypothetical protein
VAPSGQRATVYNWRIAEYHTYYVSAAEASPSLWAHNAGCNVGSSASERPDLYRTGNAQRPAPPRVGIDIVPDTAGNVHPTTPPQGLSTFDSIDALPTRGRIWRLPGDQPLPEGLGAVADPPPPGHWTIGPTESMSLDEFLDRLGQLPWVDTGRKL